MGYAKIIYLVISVIITKSSAIILQVLVPQLLVSTTPL